MSQDVVVDQFGFLNPPSEERMYDLSTRFKIGPAQVLQLAVTLLSELQEADQLEFERYVLSVSELNIRIPAF